MKERMPIPVNAVDQAFGGRVDDILPPMSEIPDEFKDHGNGIWLRWQRDWFYDGLKAYPVPKQGIDLSLAMKNLACVQGSWAPKHQHKEAGVAYLASLWFERPDGESIKKEVAP